MEFIIIFTKILKWGEVSQRLDISILITKK